MRILVTGGAGYIGSHAARYLIEKGHSVVVYDNLSTGHRRAVDPRAVFVQADITDQRQLISTFEIYKIEAVIHFAGLVDTAESFINPEKYYLNNVYGTLQLLRAMEFARVKKIVFSSTAAVYGNPELSPVPETATHSPINPYGRTKWISEMMIQDFSRSFGLSYTILRYFNVAGAWPDGSIGEDHNPESHLIPRILKNLSEAKEPVQIFGDDYPTPDGTCIRDYVHVLDLVAAHLLALEQLKDGTAEIMNIGSGSGFSVNEVISVCEKVIGKKVNVIISERRPGDSARLVASSERIRRVLGWTRTYTSLEEIVKHAWLWHTKYPQGYQD